LNLHYTITEWEFEQMSRYLDIMKDSLEEAKEDFFTSMEKQGISEDEMADVFYDDLVEVRDHYPKYYFSSFVLVWYTFIEREFLNVCYSHNKKLRSDAEKYPNGYIDTSKNYLKNEVGYSIDNPQWQKLKFIQEIRNYIAHGNQGFRYGEIRLDDQPSVHTKVNTIGDVYILIEENFYRFLESHKILEFSGLFFEIVPNYDFCKYLIEFGSEMLSKIYSDLRMK
jgi:hypothetical protein